MKQVAHSLDSVHRHLLLEKKDKFQATVVRIVATTALLLVPINKLTKFKTNVCQHCKSQESASFRSNATNGFGI